MHEFLLPDQATSSSSLDLSQFSQVFSQLTPQDVEQFQLLYQHWTLQQQIAATGQQIVDMQRQLAENAVQIERVHPSAIALATLARLQASGVEDIDLLDRMLERGEAWLDRTIQQLAYCEQLDVIRGDYEEWCRHALEDAFAWIDSLQSATDADVASVPAPTPDTSEPPAAAASDTPADETTEELFLQKLMSEEPAETAQNHDGNDSIDISDGEKGGNNDEGKGRESSTESDDEAGQEQGRAAEGQEQSQPQTQEETAQRRSNFVQRFLSALWP